MPASGHPLRANYHQSLLRATFRFRLRPNHLRGSLSLGPLRARADGDPRLKEKWCAGAIRLRAGVARAEVVGAVWLRARVARAEVVGAVRLRAGVAAVELVGAVRVAAGPRRVRGLGPGTDTELKQLRASNQLRAAVHQLRAAGFARSKRGPQLRATLARASRPLLGGFRAPRVSLGST